jgi:hypothetical protein
VMVRNDMFLSSLTVSLLKNRAHAEGFPPA